MNPKSILYKHLKDKTSITKDLLMDIIYEYPAFDLARLIYLKILQDSHDEQFVAELKASVLLIQDKALLFRFLANTHLGWSSVYQTYLDKKCTLPCKEISTIDALNLIDSFFSTNKQNTSKVELLPEEEFTEDDEDVTDLALEQQAYAAADYMTTLMQDEMQPDSASKLEHQDLIDQFISFSESENSLKEAVSVAFDENEARGEKSDESYSLSDIEPSEDDLLTESLAKIYIKQKRYEKALEIIKSLSLKYPKKSVYFADQIRYLEILIANIKKQH
ncbi:MAG: hypothetical protein ACRCXN_12720 [Bacteroidales bacterium]